MPTTIMQLEGQQKDNYLDCLLAGVEFAIGLANRGDTADYGQFSQVRQLLRLLRGDQFFSLYTQINVEGRFSGFPHISTVQNLLLDRKYSGEFLARMPSLEESVERCISLLCEPRADFAPVQKQLSKGLFYRWLQELELPSLQRTWVESCEKAGDFSSYTIASQEFSIAKMRFLTHSLLLYQKGNSRYLNNGSLTPELERDIIRSSTLSAAEIFYNLNQQGKFAVVSVERLCLGPFSTLYTENETGVNLALRAYSGRHGAGGAGIMVKDTERAATEGTSKAAKGTSESHLEPHPESHLESPSKSPDGRPGGGDPFVLELEQQTAEDEDVYFTQDFPTAMQGRRKRNFRPRIRYRRHFICSHAEVRDEMERQYVSGEYLPRFYLVEEAGA